MIRRAATAILMMLVGALLAAMLATTPAKALYPWVANDKAYHWMRDHCGLSIGLFLIAPDHRAHAAGLSLWTCSRITPERPLCHQTGTNRKNYPQYICLGSVVERKGRWNLGKGPQTRWCPVSLGIGPNGKILAPRKGPCHDMNPDPRFQARGDRR
jgi:hypothetical protein